MYIYIYIWVNLIKSVPFGWTEDPKMNIIKLIPNYKIFIDIYV